MRTYDIDGDNAAVEVQGETSEVDLDGQSLGLWSVRKVLTLEKSWNGMSDQDTAGGVELWGNVVLEESLELLLRWLRRVLGDLLECTVGWSKDGVVGLGTVQCLNQIRVVIDELGKLGGVLGLGDELVDSLVWLAVVGWVVWLPVVRRVIMVWRMVMIFEHVKGLVCLAFEPRLGVKSLVSHAGADVVGETESVIKSAPGLALCDLGVVGNSVSDLVIVLLEAVLDLMLHGLSIVLDRSSTVVGLDRDVVQNVLIGHDEGRSQSRQRQNGEVLHIDWTIK